MKTKNSNIAPRDQTPGEVRYLNYTLEFPDGEIWTDYTHVVGGLEAWVENTLLHQINPPAASALLRKGEYHWYVNHGTMGKVRHHMKLSETKGEQNWGLNKVTKGKSIEKP